MKYWQLILTALCLGATGQALAHGDAQAAHGQVKKEQQAWGIAGDARAAKRTVRISMSDDMRFKPDSITVRRGETVRFVITNGGKLLHEMVIGTRQALDEHAALMLKFPNMEHDEAHMAHVAPGRNGQMVWTFNRPGEFEFACLVAGHYQAGMRGRIVVTDAAAKRS